MSRPALTDSQDFDAHRRRRAVFAAVVGNMLEWFDFGDLPRFVGPVIPGRRPPVARLNTLAARTRSGFGSRDCCAAEPRCNAVAIAR